MGIRLGADYDLICKQTTKMLPILYSTIDTVLEDLFAEGSELAKLLIARIEGEPVETLHEPTARWRSDIE